MPTYLSPIANALVLDALAHNRWHVRAYAGMSDRMIKGSHRQPVEPRLFAVLPDDADHLKNGIKTLNAELDQLETMIWELVNSLSTQQTIHALNTELVERLTIQRRRALLTARRRGRKSATVADLSTDAAQVINRLQDQINDLRSGFEVIRAALDDAGAPSAVGLHMRIKGLAVETQSWKTRALKAEAYERQRTREKAQKEQRQRASL